MTCTIKSQEVHQMCNELSLVIKEFLNNNETYKRLQQYITLANDNLDALYKVLRKHDCRYDDYELFQVSINTETFIYRYTGEIAIEFFDKENDLDVIYYTIDRFIKLLDEADLL